MPELAEVEYFRRQWHPGVGRPVELVDYHSQARVFRGGDARAMVSALPRAVLIASHAHGKQLMFEFSSGGWLGVHLGMTGELRMEHGWPPAGRHDHLVLRQPSQSLVFADSRMFGRIRFDVSEGEPPAWWRDLPPDVMSPSFTDAWMTRQLRTRARSPLKVALLDQAIFPGIGNWMADEILWRLGLHPLTLTGTLTADQAGALHRQTQWLARRALATIGVDWRDPPVSWLYRHRWESGRRCPRPACRTPLVRDAAAGRTTCWCPACQPVPAGIGPRLDRKSVGTGRRRTAPTARVE